MTRLRSRSVVVAALAATLGIALPGEAAVGPVIDACTAAGSGDLRVAPAAGCSPVLESALQLQGAGDASGLECAGCVGSIEIADGTVAASHIADGAVRTLHVAGDAIGTAQVADGSLVEADLAFDPVTRAEDDARNRRLLVGGTRYAVVDPQIDSGHVVSATIGADGLPVMSYRYAGALRIAHCGDPDCATATATSIAGAAMSGGVDATSIAIGSDGLPVVAFQAPVAQAGFVHCGTPDCTAGNTVITLPATGIAEKPSLTIGPNGMPWIGYRDQDKGGFTLFACGNPTCSAIHLWLLLDATPLSGLTSSLAIGADGFLVASHYDGGNGNLRVTHCEDATCFVRTSVPVDGFAADVGGKSSLVIGDDGLPVIAYVDGTNADLRIVHCGTVSCASGNTTVVADPAVTFPIALSTTIGADGRPIVAYTMPGGVRLFRCGGFTCAPSAGANTSVRLDASARHGASVTIDADGRPVIAYAAGGGPTIATLRTARCMNATCASYARRR